MYSILISTFEISVLAPKNADGESGKMHGAEKKMQKKCTAMTSAITTKKKYDIRERNTWQMVQNMKRKIINVTKYMKNIINL